MYLFRKNGVNVENIFLRIFCYYDILLINMFFMIYVICYLRL